MPILDVVQSVVLLGGGLFALVRWLDERKTERRQRRFEQYRDLLLKSQETQFVAVQRVSVLLLKQYPEYRDETIEFLEPYLRQSGGWADQNRAQIQSTVSYLRSLRR